MTAGPGLSSALFNRPVHRFHFRGTTIRGPPLLLSLFRGFSFRSVDIIPFLCSIFLLYIHIPREEFIYYAVLDLCEIELLIRINVTRKYKFIS